MLPPGAVPMGLLLANLHNYCESAQPDFMAQHGKFWQGVELDLSDQDLTKHPTDQDETWVDLGFTLPGLPFGTIREDVYEGPGGWGFVTTVRIENGSDIWEKALQDGPETERAHDWEIVGDLEA